MTPWPSSAEPTAPRRTRLGAPVAVLLAGVFPGLAHLVAGRRAWAAALALPILVPVAVLLAAVVLGDPTALAVRLLDPAVLAGILLAEIVILGWRLFALAAVRVVTPIPRTPATLAALGLAVLLIVGPQAYVARLTLAARDASAQVFAPVGEQAYVPPPGATVPPVPSGDPDFALDPSPSPGEQPSAVPGSSVGPSASPSATGSPAAAPAAPPDTGGRVNVLLLGVDSGVGRTHALTDTMIVASLDPVGKTVSMVSVPRDTVDVPLPDGRRFRPKLNSLVSYANRHPDKFPGATDGQSVLAAAIGTLLQLRIDRWAQIDLAGFISLVDSVGGVTVNVTRGLCDPSYADYGDIKGFCVSPGPHQLDGAEALAFARIRHAAGESDFTRAARQQELVAAIGERILAGQFLRDPTGFLDSVGRTVRTNIGPGFVAEHLGLLTSVSRDDIFRTVIEHPLVRSGFDDRGSIQLPDVGAIRAMAGRLFPAPGVRPSGFASAS